MVGTFLKLLKWVEDTVFPNVRDVYASRPIEDRWCYSLALGKTVCPSAPFLWSSYGLHTFKIGPLDDPIRVREKKKVTSGEQGSCSSKAMLFSAKNCRILRALWAGALLRWSSHDLSSHNSCLSSCTEKSKCHRNFFIDLMIDQDIMLDDNTICVNLFYPYLTTHPSPITFQTDLVYTSVNDF